MKGTIVSIKAPGKRGFTFGRWPFTFLGWRAPPSAERAATTKMFTIELLRGQDREQPEVVHTATSSRHFVYDAEHRAKTLLADARRESPDNPPQGYRVMDASGVVVA